MGRFRRVTSALAVGLIAGVLSGPAIGTRPATAHPGPVAGVVGAESPHPERDPVIPHGDAKVPVYRTTGTTLFVCGTNQDDISQRVAAFPTDLRVANLSLWV